MEGRGTINVGVAWRFSNQQSQNCSWTLSFLKNSQEHGLRATANLTTHTFSFQRLFLAAKAHVMKIDGTIVGQVFPGMEVRYGVLVAQ